MDVDDGKLLEDSITTISPHEDTNYNYGEETVVFPHSGTFLMQDDTTNEVAEPIVDSVDDGSETLGPIDPSASILDKNSLEWADAVADADDQYKTEVGEEIGELVLNIKHGNGGKSFSLYFVIFSTIFVLFLLIYALLRLIKHCR